ncbi:MAG: hypothetical protein JZU67_03410, partial [Burkholderiaceae bacterium]|nr:hypothetical protein [Burkholderiaceae bacterium]
ADQPDTSGNFQIDMKKMDIKGDKINDEEMVQTTDKKSCFSGFAVKNHKDVSVEKSAQYANQGKETVDFVFFAM